MNRNSCFRNKIILKRQLSANKEVKMLKRKINKLNIKSLKKLKNLNLKSEKLTERKISNLKKSYSTRN
jgi:hypothetical protein